MAAGTSCRSVSAQRHTNAPLRCTRLANCSLLTRALRRPIAALLQFRRDLTVDYVKLQLQSKHKLPVAEQELLLDGKPMPDPLSLADFPALAKMGGGVVRVAVSGGSVQEETKEQTHEDEAAELAALNDEDLADDMEAARL